MLPAAVPSTYAVANNNNSERQQSSFINISTCPSVRQSDRETAVRRFVCLLRCPQGRFAYRATAQQFQTKTTNLAYTFWVTVLVRNVNDVQLCRCSMSTPRSLDTLIPPGDPHPSARGMRIVSTQRTVEVYETSRSARQRETESCYQSVRARVSVAIDTKNSTTSPARAIWRQYSQPYEH